MYIVIHTFTDIKTGHKYVAGDTYPAEGLETSAERVKELMDGSNMSGLKIIKEVKGSTPEVKEEKPKEEKPKEAKPKKAAPKKPKAKKGGTKKASK